MSASRTTKRLMSFLSLVLVFVVILSTEAQADLYVYGFEAISNNSGVSVEFAKQLSVEVTDPGPSGGFNRVLFTFKNNAVDPYVAEGDPIPGIVTDLYFDDGSLYTLAEVIDGPWVDFEQHATPGNLPGGATLVPPFETTEGFSADSETSVDNGVNQWEGSPDPVEYVSILFTLDEGLAFNDVISSIALGFTNPWHTNSLRIGLKAQAIGPLDESDGFIMTPIPGAVVLGMLGLGVAGLKLRRFA